MLYKIEEQSPPPKEGTETGEYWTVMDELNIQFKEHFSCVEVVVEGQLSDSRLAKLQQVTLALLERLDAADYQIE